MIDIIKNDIQSKILESKNKFSDFDLNKLKIILENIEFEYKYEFINCIFLKNDKWSCNYSKIIKFSPYNYINIKNILLYIILSQFKLHFNKLNNDIITKKYSDIFIENEPINIYCKYLIRILIYLQKI